MLIGFNVLSIENVGIESFTRIKRLDIFMRLKLALSTLIFGGCDYDNIHRKLGPVSTASYSRLDRY